MRGVWIAYELPPNVEVRFALRTFADTGDGFNSGRCQVAALVINRNGTSSPLDPN